MSEPKKVWWCEKHDQSWLPSWQIVAACPGGVSEGPNERGEFPCRMVRMLLVPEGSAADRLSQFLKGVSDG